MTEAGHLTHEQLTRYQNRTLTPAELLDADDHIAECGECRDSLARAQGSGEMVRDLKLQLTRHLEYDEIVAAAEGTPGAEAGRHLAECEMCQAEVEDLRQFRTQIKETPRAPITMPVRKTSWRIPMTAAAAVVLAAGLGYWALHQKAEVPAAVATVTPPVQAPTPVPVEAPLSAEQQSLVASVTANQRLEQSPILARVISKQGVLLGAASDGEKFALLAPMGTAVAVDRPLFTWKELPGASSYTVSVFDGNFERVASSPAVVGTEWQPEKPLSRGKIYNWQVTANVGARTVRAPVPPAPEARFQVVPAEVAEELESARRDHPGNHVLLAALYSKAGIVQGAASEIDAIAATDPALAQSLRESLKK